MPIPLFSSRALLSGIVLLVFCLAGSLPAVADVRTVDGSNNNLTHPEWGEAGTQLLREASGAHYSDLISSPGGDTRPSARLISNEIFAQSGSLFNIYGFSDMVWQWGQFIDHDLDLTDTQLPLEPFPIQVPSGDPHFDPAAAGTKTIPLNRSQFDPLTGTDASNPRQQTNVITSWMDGSQIYGSDPARASWLRTGSNGLLKTTPHAAGDLLPFNDGTQPNAMGMSTSFFVAGDVRANEQAGLAAMHTLFVREHNRLAGEIASADPLLTDEEIYQQARARVGAEIQAITYNEYLPALLGPGALAAYAGYKDDVNPGISSAFSTAGFRVGHTMLSPILQRLDEFGQMISEGHLPLKNAFFNPMLIVNEGGIEPILRGLGAQLMQQVDAKVVDDVRNFLFGPPGSGGLDLVSLNIQRGRDHGLADYNTLREDFGLSRVLAFDDITSNLALQQALQDLYGTVDHIDPWVGGLSEDHLPESTFGPLLQAIWIDQFERLRDADRFWYQIYSGFDPDFTGYLHNLTLADVIRANTSITRLHDHVFYADPHLGAAPEPSSVLLFALGSGLAFLVRRK